MPLLEAMLVAQDSSEGSFEPLLSWLEEIGLSLQNPVSGRITRWSEGKQFDTTVDEVRAKIREWQQDNVQMWFDGNNDVYISWQQRSISLALDAKSTDERRLILRKLVDKLIDR